MTAQMEGNVLLCFNGVRVDESAVNELLETIQQYPGSRGDDARKEMRRTYLAMKQAVHKTSHLKGSKEAGYAVRACMDAAFMHHLGSGTNVEYLFANQQSNRWKLELESYFDQVIAELPTVIETILETDEPVDDEERESLESLQWCVAKVKVLKCIIGMSDTKNTLCAIPFMTRSVYSHMARLLDMIDDSLKEVRGCPLTSRISTGHRNVGLSTMSHVAFHAFRGRPRMRENHRHVSRISIRARNARDTLHVFPHPYVLFNCSLAHVLNIQFCRWWEPFVDMETVIGKYWKPGSASAAAIRAVYGHREIKDNHTTANAARSVSPSTRSTTVHPAHPPSHR